MAGLLKLQILVTTVKSKRRRRRREILFLFPYSVRLTPAPGRFHYIYTSIRTCLHRRMRPNLISVFLLHQLIITGIHAVPLGIAHNFSLTILHTNTTIVNGTCAECICTLLASTLFFALNCFDENITCQLHAKQNQNQPFALEIKTKVSFYFTSLPTFVSALSTDTTIHELTTATTGEEIPPRYSFGERLLILSDVFC